MKKKENHDIRDTLLHTKNICIIDSSDMHSKMPSP